MLGAEKTGDSEIFVGWAYPPARKCGAIWISM
jgi:hypothetical protein